MKFFRGTFLEIPGISCDNFSWDNVESGVYFLSHIHMDHTPGLLDNFVPNKGFIERLKEHGVYVYASEITTRILKQWIPSCKDKFKAVNFDCPTVVNIPGGKIPLRVTAIPAGHCIGSVMFLFEYNVSTILYTGDFRLNASDLHKYKGFYNELGQLKTIDKIYLDVTFFYKKYNSFPKRTDAVNTICTIIQEWLIKSNDNYVNIKLPGNFGSEHIFHEIYNQMKIPIFLQQKNNQDENCIKHMYDVFAYIPTLDNVFTNDPSETKIHVQCNLKECVCRYNKKLFIKPSALRWRYREPDAIYEKGDYNQIFVCYSAHASYEEIKEFVQFLKPKAIEPNVLPESEEDCEELMKNIAELMCKEHSSPQKKVIVEEVVQIKISPRKRDITQISCDGNESSPSSPENI